MVIDWQQLKHSYLLAAMLFLTVVLLTETTSINSWLVLAVLAGHATLASKENTLGYFASLFGRRVYAPPLSLNPNYAGETAQQTILERQSALFYNPPTINNWISPYNDGQAEKSRTLSLEESILAEKSRHERMISLRDMLQGRSNYSLKESRSREMRDSSRVMRSGHWRQPQTPLLQIDLQHSDMQELGQLHQQTLLTERMQPQIHLQGVQNTIHFLAVCVQQLVIRHQNNIDELNNLLLANFGVEIVQDGQQQRYRTAQPIDLDEVVSAASCLQSAGIMKWKWLAEISYANKFQIIKEFVKLAADRAELDNYLYFEAKVAKPTYRRRAINRLRTIVGELLPSYTPISGVQLEPELEEIGDKLLVFTFLRHAINRMITATTTQEIRVRWEEQCKHLSGRLAFLMDWRNSGLLQINAAADKVFYCEPGNNNVFSAFYFYLYLLKVRYRQALKLNPELQRVVERIVL